MFITSIMSTMAGSTKKTRIQRRRNRQRLAAISFLSNISLDGSYSDTKFVVFNRKHHRLKDDISYLSKESQSVGDQSILEEENIGTLPASKNIPELGDSQLVRSAAASGEDDKVFKLSISVTPNQESVTGGRDHSSSLSNSSESSTKDIHFLTPSTRHNVRNGRVLIVSKARMPFAICSVLPFNNRHILEESRTRNYSGHSGSRSLSSQEGLLCIGLHALARVEDGQDISYKEFLVPSSNRSGRRMNLDTISYVSGDSSLLQLIGRERHRSFSHDSSMPHRSSICASLHRVPEEIIEIYDPNLLDDPELQSGSYRTLMTFTSYVTSVIDYVKPSNLKKELNEKFKEKFPNIQLTLSKLRSLKMELWRIATKCQPGTCIWTVAQAYVFFEKLIIKQQINKQNRKLCAGACLILSAKLNDTKGTELSKLIEQIEDTFRLHRKELLSFEFACLVTLEFSLHISDTEVYPHYQRLMYRS